MAPLGPFERRPRLALAVSGGPDSRALALLAAAWAAERDGTVIGLIVDHGLRPEAAAEAEATHAWLQGHGLAAQVLPWTGTKPASGLQAAARSARHDLLQRWCRAAGVLHLLLAHHALDQAETVALRRARGSGPDGLAAMAARREVEGLRLLRPLLAVTKDRLIATLRSRGQAWLEDPSNRDHRFARARLRAEGGLDHAALLATARVQGERRATADQRRALWLARHVTLDPAGFGLVARAGLSGLADDQLAAVLQRLVMTIGEGDHPPRRTPLLGLVAWLRAGAPSQGRTLAGCRILPRGERLLVCREPRAVAADRPASGARWQPWDRFLIGWPEPRPGDRVGALGGAGWRQRRTLEDWIEARSLPAAVGPSLPAVWDRTGLLAVPHLGWRHPARPGAPVAVRFRPGRALAGATFDRRRDAGIVERAEAAAWSLLRRPDSLC